MRPGRGLSRASRSVRLAVATASFAIVMGATRFGVAEQGAEAPLPHSHAPTAEDEPAVGDAADYEVLRKLLGVAPVVPAQAVATPQVEPAAVVAEDAPVEEEAIPPTPEPVAKKTIVPVKKAAPKPKPVAVARPKPAKPVATTTASVSAP